MPSVTAPSGQICVAGIGADSTSPGSVGLSAAMPGGPSGNVSENSGGEGEQARRTNRSMKGKYWFHAVVSRTGDDIGGLGGGVEGPR